jgi:hypothetical protein
MFRIKTFIVSTLCFLSFLSSCKKDDDVIPQPNTPTINEPYSSDVDVYVVGKEGGIAKYWKNGVATSLSDGSNTSIGNSIFLSGTDVYVTGSEVVKNTSPTVNLVKLWKNSVASSLSLGQSNGYSSNSAKGNSVFVSGQDVYVAGEDQDSAVLWKNGQRQRLDQDGNFSSSANSVYVSGNDVYVGGHDGWDLVLWKNGEKMVIEKESTFHSEIKSIVINGNDVYAAGYKSDTAIVWKNGVSTKLTDGKNKAVANCVFVSGSDVYVCGYESNSSYVSSPRIWKNGVSLAVSNPDPRVNTELLSIVVSGNDIFACGNVGTIQPTIWKNGKNYNINQSYMVGCVYSILVKKK